MNEFSLLFWIFIKEGYFGASDKLLKKRFIPDKYLEVINHFNIQKIS
jgi:hypothetical protein